MSYYGGIEAGGTKFVCAVGNNPDDILTTTRFPTTTPEETIHKATAFFKEQTVKIDAIGIASFGPVDLHPTSPTYGTITTTPKPGWENTDIVGPIESALNIPVSFDTDVNAAALGEHFWGEAQNLDTFVYLTIGTGIGGGVMVANNLLHGMMHPELGHIILPKDRELGSFQGICPFHHHCLEGLASGPAIRARWKVPAEELPNDHPAWELEAHYLALGLVNLILVLSPQKIILGGGVMKVKSLFPMIRNEVQHLLNGYIRTDEVLKQIDKYIVPPGLADQAGVLGAIALAKIKAADLR